MNLLIIFKNYFVVEFIINILVVKYTISYGNFDIKMKNNFKACICISSESI